MIWWAFVIAAAAVGVWCVWLAWLQMPAVPQVYADTITMLILGIIVYGVGFVVAAITCGGSDDER